MSDVMRNICIYADTTGLFSESEYESDNLIDMDFPEWILRKWYEQQNLAEDTARELKKPIEECTFEDWLINVSWAGDTDGIYDFARENGFIGVFGINTPDAVFYRDDENFKCVVFEGTYDECRTFGREHNWKWNDKYELELIKP